MSIKISNRSLLGFAEVCAPLMAFSFHAQLMKKNIIATCWLGSKLMRCDFYCKGLSSCILGHSGAWPHFWLGFWTYFPDAVQKVRLLVRDRQKDMQSDRRRGSVFNAAASWAGSVTIKRTVWWWKYRMDTTIRTAPLQLPIHYCSRPSIYSN